MSTLATLTSQQRVRRMFDRRDHDRVPRFDSFWPDTLRRWEREGLEGGIEQIYRMLDSDFHGICWIAPSIFPGREELVSEDEQTRVIRDPWGKTVRYWKHRSGTPEHLGFECDSRAVWETKYKPQLLANPLQLNLDNIRRSHASARGRWIHLTGVESFELSRYIMGDEITMIAIGEDPEWIRDFSSTYTDVILRHLDAIHDGGILADGLWIYGDMAYNHATLCSPAHYRELIWPDHRRLADWAHARGMKFIFHTDGQIDAVMRHYLDAGFDAIQPLEAKAGMDVRQLAPRYGQQIALFGNIDAMKMATNDAATIEEEIATKFAAGKATRGYIYHSDHSVPPSVSWQTYQQVMRLVNECGWY